MYTLKVWNAIFLNTIEFFFIYNIFFYRVVFFFHENVIYFEMKTEKSEKPISANEDRRVTRNI